MLLRREPNSKNNNNNKYISHNFCISFHWTTNSLEILKKLSKHIHFPCRASYECTNTDTHTHMHTIVTWINPRKYLIYESKSFNGANDDVGRQIFSYIFRSMRCGGAGRREKKITFIVLCVYLLSDCVFGLAMHWVHLTRSDAELNADRWEARGRWKGNRNNNEWRRGRHRRTYKENEHVSMTRPE